MEAMLTAEGEKGIGVFAPTSLDRSQKIYDAVHGFIRFNELERMVIDSEPFQRLHYLHQLGIAYLVYPGATHTRFEHSLGAMELATQILERIGAKYPIPDFAYWMQVIRLAALCHDLGHLPFSHDAEKTLLGPAGHEEWTVRAIMSPQLEGVWKTFCTYYPGRDSATDILKMAVGEKKLLEMGLSIAFTPLERVLSQVVTGDFFGADRIDYLLRDAQCTGVSYGLFDYHQLIEMLCILSVNNELELGIEENGIASCEALLLARHFMHQRVYQYSSVKAYKFHLARFMEGFLQGSDCLTTLNGYLSLTDCEVVTALRKASRDPSAPGHPDAESLLRKDKRFKAVAIKEGIGEGALKEAGKRAGVPADSLFFEPGSSHKSHQGLAFPVLTRSGSVVPGSELSQICVPFCGFQWAYVAPGYEKALRGALEK